VRRVLLLVAASLLALPAPAQDARRALCLFCAESEPPPRPRFLAAAGTLVAVELVPWAIDRYAADEDFARISIATVRENFRTGFQYDADDFTTNQFLHPYHGSLFFNAARANGYDFWVSGLFTLAGSLAWECCMENTPPSTNDLVNTTLGGMALGEITHRLATVLRDNEATGSSRFWREVGGTFIDPVGGIARLLHGEWSRTSPNPEERYPRGFELAANLGYRRITGAAEDADRGLLTISAAYGDPFQGEIAKPFDSFWLEADLSVPAEVITRVEGRGILTGRELTEGSAPLRTILAVWQQYEYFSNASQVFGAQAVSLGLLSRHRAGKVTTTADVGLLVFPLAGIQTVDVASPATGRTYDYAPGAGLRAGARMDSERVGVAASYGAAWAHTVNGVSDESVLQFFRASARAMVARTVGLGTEWAWYSRKTTYPGFFEARRTQTEWRVFATWRLGKSAPEPKTQLPQ
jgi:hypothetical protein